MIGPTGSNVRIFGIGLSRTGTTSLARALQILGIATVHYPHDRTTHRELASGQWQLTAMAQYQAATDISVAPFFEQLDEAFPGSRFILTVREEQDWLRSMERHMQRLGERSAVDPQFRCFTEFICQEVYGGTAFDGDRFRGAFHAHEARVRAHFGHRPQDLLVLDICAGEGWQKLCPFLGLPVPALPFPAANSAMQRDDWWRRLDALKQEVDETVPAGETLLVVDPAHVVDEILVQHTVIRFGQRAGRFLGVPAGDREAIAELRATQASGARFLVLTWLAFWWRDHFSALFAHLERNHRLLRETEHALIFELRR